MDTDNRKIIEDTLKSIGWNEFYEETIPRIEFFCNMFKSYYNYELRYEKVEVEKTVALAFCIYGEQNVYNIYSILKNSINTINRYEEHKSSIEIYRNFVNVFKESLSDDVYFALKPHNMIELFIEYCFSQHIKGKNKL